MIKLLDNNLKKKVVYMYYWQGYTEKEIAKVLSLSQQRINQIKKEALTELKNTIK